MPMQAWKDDNVEGVLDHHSFMAIYRISLRYVPDISQQRQATIIRLEYA